MSSKTVPEEVKTSKTRTSDAARKRKQRQRDKDKEDGIFVATPLERAKKHISLIEDYNVTRGLETLDCRAELTADDIKSLLTFAKNLKYRGKGGHVIQDEV